MARPFGTAIRNVMALACTSLLLSGASAHASVDFQVIDPALPLLRFGQGFESIAAWIGKRLDKVYGPQIARAKDGNERARLKEEREREIGLMKSGEAVFDGRNTGWETSIVSSDFGVGTGESMYSFKEGAETHYFFMRDGRLWKYVRTLLDGPTFDSRLAGYRRAFGAPVATTDESDGEGGRRMTSALWNSGAFDVHLVNRRTVYGTDVVIIEDRGVAAELVAARQRAAKKPGLGGVSSSLEGYLLDDPDTYGAPPAQPDQGSDTPKKPKNKKPR